MSNNWVISNKIIPEEDFEFIKNYGNFHIGISELDNIRIVKEDFWIFLDGYVILDLIILKFTRGFHNLN